MSDTGPDEAARMIKAMLHPGGAPRPTDPMESRPLDFHESVRATMLASFTLHLASWSLWIARALGRDPAVLFLDEPTASLDPASTQAIAAFPAPQRSLWKVLSPACPCMGLLVLCTLQ